MSSFEGFAFVRWASGMIFAQAMARGRLVHGPDRGGPREKNPHRMRF